VCAMSSCRRCKKHICWACVKQKKEDWQPIAGQSGPKKYVVEETSCCGAFICCRKEERDLNKDGLLRVNKCQLCCEVYCENCKFPDDCAKCNRFFCKQCAVVCERCQSTFCKKCAVDKIIETTCCGLECCCYKDANDDDNGVVISVWKKGEAEPQIPEPDERNEKGNKPKCSISIFKCQDCKAILCDECEPEIVQGKFNCRKCGRSYCNQDDCPNGVTFCQECENPYCSDAYGCRGIEKCIMNSDGCGIKMCSNCWTEQPHCENLEECERYPVCHKHLYFCSCKKRKSKKRYCAPCGLSMSYKCDKCKDDLKSNYLTNANDSDDNFCEEYTPKSSI